LLDGITMWWCGLYTVVHIQHIVTENNKKLSYRRDSALCVKRPFKVTQGHLLLYRSMYDFLLALSSNLTSSFNHS